MSRRSFGTGYGSTDRVEKEQRGEVEYIRYEQFPTDEYGSSSSGDDNSRREQRRRDRDRDRGNERGRQDRYQHRTRDRNDRKTRLTYERREQRRTGERNEADENFGLPKRSYEYRMYDPADDPDIDKDKEEEKKENRRDFSLSRLPPAKREKEKEKVKRKRSGSVGDDTFSQEMRLALAESQVDSLKVQLKILEGVAKKQGKGNSFEKRLKDLESGLGLPGDVQRLRKVRLEMEKCEKEYKDRFDNIKKRIDEKIAEIEEESKMCIICLENPRDVVLIPCGHIILCQSCGGKVSMCPNCRKPISNRTKIFM